MGNSQRKMHKADRKRVQRTGSIKNVSKRVGTDEPLFTQRIKDRHKRDVGSQSVFECNCNNDRQNSEKFSVSGHEYTPAVHKRRPEPHQSQSHVADVPVVEEPKCGFLRRLEEATPHDDDTFTDPVTSIAMSDDYKDVQYSGNNSIDPVIVDTCADNIPHNIGDVIPSWTRVFFIPQTTRCVMPFINQKQVRSICQSVGCAITMSAVAIDCTNQERHCWECEQKREVRIQAKSERRVNEALERIQAILPVMHASAAVAIGAQPTTTEHIKTWECGQARNVAVVTPRTRTSSTGSVAPPITGDRQSGAISKPPIHKQNITARGQQIEIQIPNTPQIVRPFTGQRQDRRTLVIANRSGCTLQLLSPVSTSLTESQTYKQQTHLIRVTAPDLNSLRKCMNMLDAYFPSINAVAQFEKQNRGF